MPGVVVTTATRSGPSAPLRAPSGQYFVAGLAERGSTREPVEIRSMADYVARFGERVTYGFLFDDLQTFFEEGGSRAWVARVVGNAATLGTLTLTDRAGTPVNTLRIDAENAGAWSSRLTVQVRDGANPSTFRVTLALDGVLVEDYNNLTSPDDAVAKLATSRYVRATNLGSASAAPLNNPGVRAATALTAGTDDRAAVTPAMLTGTTLRTGGAAVNPGAQQGLALFDIGLGPGAVAVPGYGALVHTDVASHARNNRRIALLAAGRGTTVDNLISAAAAVNSEYAGLFAPHVLVPDGSGGTRAIEPLGFVAAKRNRAHEETGPWRAAAGGVGVARYVVGVDQSFSRAEGDTLDTARVSAIRVVSRSVRLYGWRSLSQDEANYSLLTGRDLLNYLVDAAEARLEFYVFQTIDGRGQLISQIEGELIGLVEPIRSAGGLYEKRDAVGDLIDPGYSVDTGPGVNTLDTIARNELRARLAVRISPSAALVSLTIIKVGVTAAV